MKMSLQGHEHVTPQNPNKSPFTMLYGKYPKHGVTGEVCESIYVADGFPLPPLTVGMIIEVDRDGKGYLLAITEVKPSQNLKINN